MLDNCIDNLNFHIYAGSSRGAIAYTNCEKNQRPTYELKELDGEVTAFEWGESNNEILIGNKNGVVKIFDTGLGKYQQHIQEIEGNAAVVGLASLDRIIIAGQCNGTVNIYNRVKKKAETFGITKNEKATTNAFVYNKQRNVFATGGDNNDLKIWDLNARKEIFKAKSLGKDELELPIPTSIRGISFLNDGNIVGCVTKEGMVLLYDENAQRKPVKQYQEKKAAFTCLTSYRDRQFMVGTTKGYLQLIDMRQGKCVKTFQPFAGSVTSIVCDDTLPYVASASLDKHLRIHNVDTKQIVHKEYMKIGLTKILMRPVAKEETKHEEPEAVDAEYEGMFDNMETIHDDGEKVELKGVKKVVKRKKQTKTTKIEKSSAKKVKLI